jgi:hypothetical protein
MGKGSSTSQSDVQQQVTKYTNEGAGQLGSPGVDPSESRDVCLVSFSGSIDVGRTGLSVRDTVTLMPGKGLSIWIMVRGEKVGEYSGQNLTTLLDCMKKKYVYVGQITDISDQGGKTRITFIVSGRGIA